jgi:NADPH:quinone reductase-like Zn-dependent oxidoreductase
MRAIAYNRYGGPEVLELLDLPKPKPERDQVLIQVHAGSINPIDWKKGSGALRIIMPACYPVIPGYDIAGKVVEVGAAVTTFSIGDQVHARIGETKGGGSAEFAAAGVDVTVRMPEGMSYADAAALPLAGMTALQGLRDQGDMPLQGAKQRVLIVGASGGVGHLAVQIARAAGAHVVGVCSGRNVELVTGLGAHEVLDYTKENPYQGQAPFDVVLDCVAGDPTPWLPLLGPEGRYATCLPGAASFARSALNLVSGKKVRPVLLKSNAADLAILDALYVEKKLRVVIDSRFPLESLSEAWTRSMSGRAAGKIVIDIAS